MWFRIGELADAMGGSIIEAAPAAGSAAGPGAARTGSIDALAVDSRLVERGQGFVALVAGRDGHDFVEVAVGAGASVVVVSRVPEAPLPVPVVVVPDTAVALLDAGRAARARLGDRVVGITGSVGKTSTKDLLATILARRYRTAASTRSFNNEIGVPLTLVGAHDATEAVVVEMGARGLGHVALLCEVARPTAAIVTAVVDAHLEMFGSVEDVARAKGELVEALPPAGVAVLNADDPRVAAMAGRTNARTLTYGVGRDSDADVRAVALRVDELLHPTFTLRSPWGERQVHLAVHGAHQAANAVAAAACALAHDVDLDDVTEALAEATVSGMRMQVDRTRSGGIVINDAYNANPASTRAALDALAALPARRRTAVLGAMAELGPDSDRLHEEVTAHARSLGVSVVAVGTEAYGPDVAERSSGVDGALDRLGPVGPDDAVLVKGSRVAGLERIAEALIRS